MTQRRWCRALLVVLLTGVLVLAACGGGAKKAATPGTTPSASASASASATATATPPPVAAPPCPVDQAICDFARQAEDWVRRQDAASLVAGSSWDNANDREIVRASIANVLHEKAKGPIRLLSIGCPMASPPRFSCDAAFSLAFTGAGRGSAGELDSLVFGFSRDAAARPALTMLARPDSLTVPMVVNEGDAHGTVHGPGCNLSGMAERFEGECIDTYFYHYETETPPALAGLRCPVEDRTICEFAIRAEKALLAGDLDEIVKGSAHDDPAAREALRGAITHALGGFPPPSALLVSVGCPFAATALGCGETFGIAFSTLAIGTEPGEGASGIFAFAFARNPGKPPVLLSAGAVEGAAYIRRAVLSGGLAQGGGYAGRPPANTDSSVRSYWYPFSSKALPPPGVEAPETIAGVTVEKWKVGPSVPITADEMFLIERGCWGCEGYSNGIDRVWRDRSGKLRNEPLPLPPNRGITGLRIRRDTFEMVVILCTRGYCGPLNAVTPDAETKAYRSRDGGMSWELLDTFPGGADLRALTPEGFIVMRGFGPGDPREWVYADYTWPAGTKLQPPRGTRPYGLFVTPDGAVVYPTTDRRSFIAADGSTYWTFPAGVQPDEYPTALRVSPDGTVKLASWHANAGNPPAGRTYVAVLRGGRIEAIRAGEPEFQTSWWLGNDVMAGNIMVTNDQIGLATASGPPRSRSVPAVIDFRRGSGAPVEAAFFDEHYVSDRSWVAAVIPGPFMKVKTPGDCLNVRETSSAASPALACYRDGVLLRTRTGVEAADAEGRRWAPVFTIDGREGWAAEEYLER